MLLFLKFEHLNFVKASKSNKCNPKFSSNSSKEYKKKKVKKLEEISDSDVNFSQNKIVIQRCSLKPFVVQAVINN